VQARRRWSVGSLLLIVATLVAMHAVATRRAERTDAWLQITETGLVRVAMDASYPPFEWVDEHGVYHGYDVALAQALAARWGVQVQFVNIAFDGLYDALEARKADLILSALPYDALLTQDVRFSQPYFAAGQVIMVPAGATGIALEADLGSKVVAVELGAEGHAVLQRLNRDRGLDIVILPRHDLEQAAAAVEAGEADALVCDRVDALRLASRGTLAIAGEPLTVEPFVVAVRLDSPKLLTELDKALEALANDGTLAALERQWLQRQD